LPDTSDPLERLFRGDPAEGLMAQIEEGIDAAAGSRDRPR
jgi:hypothetical protein